MNRLAVLLCVITTALGGNNLPGQACMSTNDRLDAYSHKFVSDCDDPTFCPSSGSYNNTCVLRRCRRDEFPFGFDGFSIPPQCPSGEFCPDEGSACQPLGNPGQSCQLNRNEQCASPGGLVNGGAICLNSQCLHANATLGQPCVFENTTYTNFGPSGEWFTNVVTRDNCVSLFYCDISNLVCVHSKEVGEACLMDQECGFNNCANNGLCADPLEAPVKVQAWQYAVTGLCILTAMIATCTMLILLHKRHRYEHQKEIREYYEEQTSLRRSIIALHSAAAERYTDGLRGR